MSDVQAEIQSDGGTDSADAAPEAVHAGERGVEGVLPAVPAVAESEAALDDGGENGDEEAPVAGGDAFDTDCWRTPDWLFGWLSKRYGPYELDAAADEKNAKCHFFIDEELDALSSEWADGTYNAKSKAPSDLISTIATMWRFRSVFCNPPYSKPNLPAFMAKAREEGVKPGAVITMVVPNTRDAAWFHDNCFRGANVMSNEDLRMAKDESGSVRWGQLTKYDANGCYIEVIEIEQRVKFHRPRADGTWGPTGSPAGGTAIVTFISKVKA